MINLPEIFKKHDDEFLTFEKVENKRSTRADLHAFILLDSLISGNSDMIGAAEHDEIFIHVDLEELAKVATEDQILDLIRCGIRLNEDSDSLAMFV